MGQGGGARASARFTVRNDKTLEIPEPLAFRKLKRRERRASGRFRFSCKIITAMFAAMRFDGGMTRRGEHLVCVPACIGSRFDALIG
jgi:hypothetical protein